LLICVQEFHLWICIHERYWGQDMTETFCNQTFLLLFQVCSAGTEDDTALISRLEGNVFFS
jgi:hypothetical protein